MAIMKCKQCGTENKAGAVMCSSCGYVFDTDEEMFSENEKTINAEAFHKQSQIEEIKRRRDKKRKRKKIKKIILILLIILIAAGAVFAAFYMSDKQDEKIIGENSLKPAKNSPTPVPTETLEPLPEPTEEVTPVPTEEIVPTESAEPTEVPTVVEATPRPETTQRPVATQRPATTSRPAATQRPAVTPRPTVRPAMNSTLVVVERTVSDENGSFVVASTNGKKIYIQGMSAESNSYAIVSATDSGIKVDNIPVYNATSTLNVANSEFIMPESSFRILTNEDVLGLSVETLRLARNEIYARHGRTFKDASLNEYFGAKSWYKVNPSYNYRNDVLNISETENINAHFLLDVERALLAQ